MKMKRKEFAGYVMPSMVLMFLFTLVPLIFTVVLSFYRYSLGQEAEFIGIANYISTLTSRRFWNAMGFTIFVTVVTTAVKLVLALVIALLLYSMRNNRGRGGLISCIMMPFIVTPVVGTMVFGWMFKDFGGFYNWLLSLVGLKIEWFSNAGSAQLLVMIHWIWAGVAFGILVFYSALQNMSLEPLEAATVDGATWWQKIRKVILPQLSSLIVFVLMVDIMDAYRMYDSVAVLTKGGPAGATETLMYYNYNVSFTRINLGEGSAISVLTVIGIILILIPFLRVTYKEQTD